ncbi:MAG: flavodoxin family protein, partial [Gammaproteobacteria bacterium]
MKVIAINGSPRKNGNTSILISKVFSTLNESGIKTEEIQLAGNAVRGCTACYICKKEKNGKCVIQNDIVNLCIEKMKEADGIILASPTYFANVSAEMKAVIDRTGVVNRANDFMFRRKIGAAIVTARRAGQVTAFDAINHYFL